MKNAVLITAMFAIGVAVLEITFRIFVAIIKPRRQTEVYLVHGPHKVEYYKYGEHTQKVVCMYCGEVIQYNHGCSTPGLSHGLCKKEKCKNRLKGGKA